MVYYGIDWSEDSLSVCLLNDAEARLSQFVCDLTPTGLARFEAERTKLGLAAAECPVAIETSYHPVVDYLLARSYPVYLVPPAATEGFRNRRHLSGAHTDASDAALLASIVRTDRATLQRWQPNTALTQQLHALVRLSESLRVSIQRQTSQLRALLLRAFPLAIGLFGELTTPLALHFLAAYPSLPEARTLTRDTLSDFCRRHGDRRTDLIVTRLAHLSQPSPPIVEGVSEAQRDPIRLLASVLLAQVQARAQTQDLLTSLFAQHPDAPLFASLPGAADLLAPALLVKFGDERSRFPTPSSVQVLAGTCPVTKQSGKGKVILFRQGCDKEFRRIAHQYAFVSLTQASWAKAYWQAIRLHSKSDAHATRALANRWLAIIWKLWQAKTPYDEAYHLKQRAQRARPTPTSGVPASA